MLTILNKILDNFIYISTYLFVLDKNQLFSDFSLVLIQ